MDIGASSHDDGADAPGLGRLRRAIVEAAAIEDPTERLLEVAAVIGDALRGLGVEPVVVGGLALAYWTDSAFLTGDIDLVVRRPPELSARLEALGFERKGREWVMPDHNVVLEAPGETLEPGDRAEAIELASGRRVLVLSIEDLLLWRLREWLHWKAVSGFQQAGHLLIADTLDRDRLDRRAKEEGLTSALLELQKLMREIEKGRRYEDWELIEAAGRVQTAGYSHDDE